MDHGVSGDLIRSLGEGIVNGKGACFVGAGLSVGAGLPSWDELVAPLRRALRPPTSERSPMLIAQYYRNQEDDRTFYDYLRGKVSALKLEPTEAHEILCSLPVSTFVTTNYDDLLERTFDRLAEQARARGPQKPVNVITDNSQMAFWPANERATTQLLKIHGDLKDVSTIVFTERDYASFLLQNSLIKNKLTDIFSHRTVLFFGYSLRDPNVSLVLESVSRELGNLKGRAYMITFDKDVHREREWARWNLHTVHLSCKNPRSSPERTQTLISFLLDLREEARRADGDRQSVLVVDDNPDVLRAVEMSLRNSLNGIPVHTAGDGYEAMGLAVKYRPQVVIVDLEMPKMGGLELIAAMRKLPELDGTEVIVFAGVLSSWNPFVAADLDIKHCLTKDRLKDLVAHVRTLMRVPETMQPPVGTIPPPSAFPSLFPSADADARSVPSALLAGSARSTRRRTERK